MKEGTIIDKGKEVHGIRKELTLTFYWYDYGQISATATSSGSRSIDLMATILNDVNKINANITGQHHKIQFLGAMLDVDEVGIEEQNELNRQAKTEITQINS